jgi:hypothetical protein
MHQNNGYSQPRWVQIQEVMTFRSDTAATSKMAAASHAASAVKTPPDQCGASTTNTLGIGQPAFWKKPTEAARFLKLTSVLGSGDCAADDPQRHVTDRNIEIKRGYRSTLLVGIQQPCIHATVTGYPAVYEHPAPVELDPFIMLKTLLNPGGRRSP